MALAACGEPSEHIFQGRIKDKDANGGRDLFTVKKGFGSLPFLDGRVDKNDDWRFEVVIFLEMKDNFLRTVGVDREANQDAGAGRPGCAGVRPKKPERVIDERPTPQLSLPQSLR